VRIQKLEWEGDRRLFEDTTIDLPNAWKNKARETADADGPDAASLMTAHRRLPGRECKTEGCNRQKGSRLEEGFSTKEEKTEMLH